MLDPTFLLLLPAIILSFYAQHKVGSTFKKYSKTRNRRGYTGADVARQLLRMNGVTDVNVERVSGNLTDHYDPRAKVVRLSDTVYNSTSLAALGVAAHETGHAMQHYAAYSPLTIRHAIFPAVNISTSLATPLIFIGFLLSMGSGDLGIMLIYLGIILFSVVVAFQIITLPVEFNASSRAIQMLVNNQFIDSDEVAPAKKVLSAAALTYLAAAAVSIAHLIRFILMLRGIQNRD